MLFSKFITVAATCATLALDACQPPQAVGNQPAEKTIAVAKCDEMVEAAEAKAEEAGKKSATAACPAPKECAECEEKECPQGDAARMGPDQIEAARSGVRCLYVVRDQTSAYYNKDLTSEESSSYQDEVIPVIGEDPVARVYTAVVPANGDLVDREWNIVYFATADLTKDPKKNGHFLTSANLASSYYDTNECEKNAKEKLSAAKSDEDKTTAQTELEQCIKDVQFKLVSQVPELCPDWVWDMRRK